MRWNRRTVGHRPSRNTIRMINARGLTKEREHLLRTRASTSSGPVAESPLNWRNNFGLPKFGLEDKYVEQRFEVGHARIRP